MIRIIPVILLLLIILIFYNNSKELPYDHIKTDELGFDNSWFPKKYEQEATAASIDWQNYTKPNIHLKLQYPSDWQKVENQNNITLFLSQNDSIVPFGGNLSIESYPSGNTPLNKLVSLKIHGYREHWSSFVLNNSITDTIGDNITAYKIVYTYSDDNKYKPYTVMELWTIIDGNAYVIRYQGEATRFYSAHLPTVEKIIDSIDIQRTAITKMNTQNYPALI